MEKDKKRTKLDDGEMNGHPTGKPAFAVERFYSPSDTTTTSRRRSRRLKDLDSGSDSDSKMSDYDYDGSSDDERSKRPERHIYLRRHIIEDDDDDDEDVSEGKTNGKCGSDNEMSDGENEPETEKNKEPKTDDSEDTSKQNGDEGHDPSVNDSQDSNRDNTDASSEKSGPTVAPASSPKETAEKEEPKEDKPGEESLDKDTPDQETPKNDEDEKSEEKKGDMEEKKENTEDKKDDKEDKDDKDNKDMNKEDNIDTLEVPKSRPPPLERISPRIDPLLDSLGFGALASFTNSDKYSPSRADQYGTLRSPTQNIRSPLTSNTGFSTDRLGVPQSPSSYPRVSADSRFGTYPPTYDQTGTSYANYLGYNQTNFSSTTSMDAYPGSPTSRQSYPGLNFPGTRQFPGYSPTKRDTSPSYNPPPPYSSTGYPYPSNDMTSRPSYYPSTNQGYSLPTKNPYPPQGYFPDDPFATGMFYGNTGTVQPGGVSSWPTTPATSSPYYPPNGMGQKRTGI